MKPALDVGVQTNSLAEHEAFWGDGLGLDFDHVLPVGGGVRQHRYGLHGGVLKLNHHRDPLPADAPTGYTALAIVDPRLDRGAVDGRVGPDGVRVAVMGPPSDGTLVHVLVSSSDVAQTVGVLASAFGASVDGTNVRIGETRLAVKSAPGRAPTLGRDGLGIRYLTVQVRDVVAAHAEALAAGMAEGMAPIRLGDVAAISFVRLPDGDWIELSQRASLTGPLPEDLPAVGH